MSIQIQIATDEDALAISETIIDPSRFKGAKSAAMGESIATGMNAQACDKRCVPLENVAADGYGFAHSGQKLLDHSARFGEFETQSSGQE
ncbi:hypothetical protein [Pseudomonas sp. FR229a]|uniref:hypothetical protein n=1 Tax=Pseudomonas sp. FR229a TaxID=3040313 RepID=UPI002554083A|nr:hypothetical protein [Pseudomonas sp. FR229a]